MTDPPLEAAQQGSVSAAVPTGSASERFLDGLRRHTDADRWVVCWRDNGTWRVRSSEPSLRDDLLLQQTRDHHGAISRTAQLIPVSSLGDSGTRLATAGTRELLVLRAGEEALIFLEDPAPEPAARIVDAPGPLGAVDIAAMLEAERHAAELARLAAAPSSAGDDTRNRQDALLRERARIGSVIHEGITQVLTNVAIQLEVTGHVLDDPDQARSMLTASREAVLEALDSLRTIIFDLTPRTEEWADLAGGLRRFAGDFSAQWGIEVEVRVTGEPRDVDAEVTSLAFAFVQEGLTNARKHADTDEVQVLVEFRSGRLAVEVADDGVGIDIDAHEERSLRQHQGLKLMESRIRLMDGTFSLDAGVGSGVRLRMEVPA